MHVAQDLQPWLEKSPQPVAVATGRVVRAIGSVEKLDACVKAAEVIARFIAVASLASSAATRPSDAVPPQVANFVGNLSFGVFENAARAAAAVTWDHPLREQLRLCLKSAKKRKAIAGQRLAEFVELRNELGHAITPADEARARALLERDDPVGGLIELLEGLENILACPLLVLLGQEHRRGRLLGRFAFFAGDGEPIPQGLELRDPLYEWETPYLCTPCGLIPLAPGLLYQPRPEPIACLDGRSLHGYLSGEGAAQAGAGTESMSQPLDEPAPNTDGSERSNASVRDFEQRLNSLALGIAYRDVLYCLAAHGARAELTGDGVRVVTTSEPARVLATIEVTLAKRMRVAVYAGALASGGSEQAEEHELRAGESADWVVDHIKSLLEGHEPTETGGEKAGRPHDSDRARSHNDVEPGS